MMRLKSLQQRYSIFILLPVAFILFGIGFAGFTYIRKLLLSHWGEATLRQLQLAAHQVDMRLSWPKEMMQMLNKPGGMPPAKIRLILDQIQELEWVARVDLSRSGKEAGGSISEGLEPPGPPGADLHGKMMKGFAAMPFHHGNIVDVTSPYFDSSSDSKTVSLVSELKDADDQVTGRLEVAIHFDYLFNDIEAAGWWKDHEHRAYLIDDRGNVLLSNLDILPKKLDESDTLLARAILHAIKTVPYGTVLGKGLPPKEVGGFYKLREAPWTLLIVAPGAGILSEIVNFSIYYIVFGGVAILIVLIIIRQVTGRTALSIKAVSSAARAVAEGDYDVSLPVKSRDEMGELIQSFNTMVNQLEERARLKYSLNLAREVQQNLLPGKSMQFDSLDVAGQSIYCDETGGDYYDFLAFPELGEGRSGIVVGDVSGHGISAALFMATARALIRSRIIQPGGLAQVITDTNRLLCIDTEKSGNFMTLFFLMFDLTGHVVRWVRAGHEPALLYDAATDNFTELGGKGIALGVDEKWSFTEYSLPGWDRGKMVMIGTDGIWETENERGERFGKDRLREILRTSSHHSAEKIIRIITDSLAAFRQNAPQADDITLVVVKARA
ncbi:MAG: SpoIIE family protein phosphatase [Desulfobacterales bacterium]|nr:SpoIIE family protein phosphatase [Desulfobacterales bacterium]